MDAATVSADRIREHREEASRYGRSHRKLNRIMASWRSKNPHSSFGSAAAISEVEMRELSFEKRIRKQWENSSGSPIDEDFKEKFVVRVGDKNFIIADIRIWQYRMTGTQELGTEVPIEFFFDGSESEITDKAVFIANFQKLLEDVVQERRIGEFRKQLAGKSSGGMRKRGGGGATATTSVLDSNTMGQPLVAREETGSTMDADALEGGDFFENAERGNEDSWKHFLAKDYEGTGLQVESFREAGCVLIFVVAQSTLSATAAETLGQEAFPEHFPVDGKPQELKPEKDKPMPTWIWYMAAFGFFMLFIVVYAWYNVFIAAQRSGKIPAVFNHEES